MEDKKYQVLFYGEILPGADPEQVKDNLARTFKLDRSRIEPLFSGGKKVVKKDAARELCEKTKRRFEAAGAVVSVVPQTTRQIPPPPPDLGPDEIFFEFTDGASSTAATEGAEGDPDSAEKDEPAGDISKSTLLLLTFFLGGFGVHKFYLARYFQGALSLLFCWTGIPGLISLIEFLIYAFTDEETLQRRYRSGSTPLVIMMAVFGPFFLLTMAAVITLIVVPLVAVSRQNDIIAPIRKMISRPPAPASEKTIAAPQPRTDMPDVAEETVAPDPVPAPATVPPVSTAATPGEHRGGCYGKIKGLDFFVEHASLQNGVLHLKQGQGFFADREVVIFMLLKDSKPSGQQIKVSANRDSTSNPHIHLRWKSEEDDTPQSDVLTKGYDLYLEFGEMTGRTLPGKIDLNISGALETRLAGTFMAEVTEP